MDTALALPLQPTEMVEFFKNKEALKLVDLTASVTNLKTNVFVITYAANLGIRCVMNEITADFLADYMRSTIQCDMPNVSNVHANVLYYAKYQQVLYPEALSMFNEQAMCEFIESNSDLVFNQMDYINSLQLYLLCKCEEIVDGGDLITNRNDDLHVDLGMSILNLLSKREFMLEWFVKNPPLDKQIYFTRYFDENMYAGTNLFSHIANNNNLYMAVMSMVVAANDSSNAAAVLLNHVIYLENALDGNSPTEQALPALRPDITKALEHLQQPTTD